ncbi:hypothetical protein D3C86_2242930 [compost metagenome]
MPASIQRQPSATVSDGVFQVDTRMARSRAGTSGPGAATNPILRPDATLFDKPET